MDGLELKETTTRAAGAEPDPARAIALSGRTATTNGWYVVLFEDDFEDAKVDLAWKVSPYGPGLAPLHATSRVEEQNGRLTLYLDPTDEAQVLYMLGSLAVDRNVTLEEGQTLEARLDLAGFGAGSAELIAVIPHFTASEWTTTDQKGYSMEILNNGYTWSQKAYGHEPEGEFGNAIIPVLVQSPAYRAGYSLVLSVTRSGPEEILLGMRVLDRNQGNTVRLARTWTDTAGADPVSIYGVPDIEGSPYMNFRSMGFTYIIASEVPFAPVRNLSLSVDSYSLRLFESSPYELEIERAVLLTPPSSSQPYVVEAAENVTGPWEVLSTSSAEVHGRTHLVVPIAEAPAAKWFRIR